MSHEITVRQVDDMETYGGDQLAKIIDAVTRGDLPVETMERLVALSERMMEDRRRQAFADSMARVHAKIPPMDKKGRVIVGGTERSRYAQLEDIHKAMQPLLAEEGLSVSFDEVAYTDKNVTFEMKVLHRNGHGEVKRKTLAHDKAATGMKGPIRNATQDDVSTSSYARRVLYKMHFDIIEIDEDTDGNNLEPISEEQCRDLTALCSEVKGKPEFLCELFGVKSFSEILQRDYDKAVRALEMKRKAQR